MNLDLTPDEAGFREEVRAFIAANLTPELRRQNQLTTAMYPDPHISLPWHKALAKKGWVAPLWPVEYGGTGWSAMQRFIFDSECGVAGAPPIPPFGIRLVGPVILRFGTEAQKQFYLPKILSGEDYWCQGYSEPGAGSDLASLQCRAVRDGDEYVINGTKIWTTHAHFANRMFALVRTSTQGKQQEGISFVLLDMDTPGLTVRPIRSIAGEHEVNQIFFDDVRIPAANLVGKENDGWTVAKYLLEFERGGGLFSGRHRSNLSRIRRICDVLEERGVSILASPLKRAKFAEVTASLDVYEMLELSVIRDLAPGESIGAVASVLKLQSARMKQEIGMLGIDLLGPYALEWWPEVPEEMEAGEILLHTPTMDYLNGRAHSIFGGAQEVQLTLISRSVLGR